MTTPEAKWATELGAIVSLELSPTTTHLVGVLRAHSSKVTGKIRAAEAMVDDGCSALRYLVHLGDITSLQQYSRRS